jgi:hypothetical protein
VAGQVLPFTGLSLTAAIAFGLVLLATGIALRRKARPTQ